MLHCSCELINKVCLLIALILICFNAAAQTSQDECSVNRDLLRSGNLKLLKVDDEMLERLPRNPALGVRGSLTRPGSSGQTLSQLRAVIGELRKRDLDENSSEKLGMYALSSIHGRPATWSAEAFSPVIDNIVAQCPHMADDKEDLAHDDGKEAILFLLWHRAYIMAFEATAQSVLRSLDLKAEGVTVDPDSFRLPYWNWIEDGRIPEAFRQCKIPVAGTSRSSLNPLYAERLKVDIRGTDQLMGDSRAIYIDTQPSLFENTASQGLERFAVELRDSWHGTVHSGSGTLMQESDTAAFDPIFWVHHAFVDLLFQDWLNKTGQPSVGDVKIASELWEKAIKNNRFKFLVEVDGRTKIWKPKFAELAINVPECGKKKVTECYDAQRVGKRVWENGGFVVPEAPDRSPAIDKDLIVTLTPDQDVQSGCSKNASKNIVNWPQGVVGRGGVNLPLTFNGKEMERLVRYRKSKTKQDGDSYISTYISIRRLKKVSPNFNLASNFHVFLSRENEKLTFKEHYIGTIPAFGLEKSDGARPVINIGVPPKSLKCLNDSRSAAGSQDKSCRISIIPSLHGNFAPSEIADGPMLSFDGISFAVRGKSSKGGKLPKWCAGD